MKTTLKLALGMALAVMAGSMVNAQEVIRTAVRTDIETQTDGSVVRVKQVKDDLFAGTEKFATGATDVTEINLDPKMMGMVHGGGDGELAHKMKFMVIHTYTYDKPGMYKPEDVEAYRKKLEDGTWSCSVHTKDKSGTTDICSRNSSGDGSEMVILTAEPKELTFIHMSGNMSLSELSKMGGGMGGGSSSHHTPMAPMPPMAPMRSTPPAAPVAPAAPASPR
jgi:Domain of unknown function (DUF4252)